ncbi:MAG: methyl-accepting chemotaxis protein [Lachnospiraceae bacterium]|nr:methyl-accepting chemotaxis protein [Lachnospiraceae bacterium]
MKDQKKQRKFKFSLFSMLITLSLIPLILSIGIISTISVYVTKNNLEEESQATLYIVANNLANYCRENEINAINASNYYEYLDSLKEQNIEMAIIIDGAPCATSIKNENDYRIREIEVQSENTEGYFDQQVVIDNKEYFAYYMPIESNGEVIGMAFAGELQENVTGAINSIVLTFAGIAVFLVVIFAILALTLSRGLVKSFRLVGRSVNALSKGDLSVQVTNKSPVKEMSVLLSEAEVMQKNLSEIIGKVKDVSQTLVDNIAEVTRESESSFGRANQITTSMQELSASTMKMGDYVQDIQTQMIEIGNCINDISLSVDHLYNTSENIVKTNQEAQDNMDMIMTNSRQSVEAVRDIALQIKETNSSITEVDKAVELILSISQQTNLLSLNASIEAARAGEFGRGFAVVAEEIRHLSEQSAEGAEMIKNLAQTITQKSKKSVELADKVHSLIIHEQENVSKTQNKYEELSRDITVSVEEIKSIADKTDNLTDYKEKVIDNVQNLSAISEENTANNEEVNNNIDEITSEVQIVNDNCEKMNDMAKELEKSVAYFVIDKG